MRLVKKFTQAETKQYFKEMEATMQNDTDNSSNTDIGLLILWVSKQKGQLPIWSQWSKHLLQMGKAKEK